MVMTHFERELKIDLVVAVCTCNNAATITQVLQSIDGIASRIVVVDSGSTDDTIDICESFGAEVFHRRWGGMVPQRRHVLNLCATHTWVLVLDSDESLEPDLQESVQQAVAENTAGTAGYEFNRKVWFLGGWLHHVFQPEWRLRLVRGGTATVHGSGGHDSLSVEGTVKRLRGTCRHDSWRDVGDMFRRYIALAKQAAADNRRGGSIGRIIVSPMLALFKQLILKRGILDGRRGFLAAVGASYGTLLKHLFIMVGRTERLRERAATDAAPNSVEVAGQGRA